MVQKTRKNFEKRVSELNFATINGLGQSIVVKMLYPYWLPNAFKSLSLREKSLYLSSRFDKAEPYNQLIQEEELQWLDEDNFKGTK
jgi:hypothetical protein